MQRTNYPAVIERGADEYGVYFPDLPGSVSAGSTIAEAIQNAHEALALHVAGMCEDSDELPAPSAIGSLPPPPVEVHVETVVLIGVSLPTGRSAQVSITLDESLLQEIDGLSSDRSRFMADAARAEIARRTTT